MRFTVAVMLVLAGCKHGAEEPREAEGALPEVRVMTVALQQVTPRVPIAGVLAPLPGKDVKVGALVGGRVDAVFVAEGDRVKVGQALAHVEAEPLRQHVSEAVAVEESARAALDNARTRLARTEKLWKDGITSRQDVDDAHAALVAAQSGLKGAQAGGGLATGQLDRATLRAPIDGVVAAILVPAGQPVDGSGTPVIEVADTRVLDLRAPVNAGRIGEVSVGQKAVLSVEGVGEVQGAVEAIAPLVDPTTNTVTVRVRLPNATGKLRGGMFARGALLLAARPAMSVPRSALLPGDGGSASMVAVLERATRDGGTARDAVAHRALVLGVEAGDDVEVRAGLEVGDRVIVAGGYALPDGAEVTVTGTSDGPTTTRSEPKPEPPRLEPRPASDPRRQATVPRKATP